jgi:aspartyl aminopeptidase
MVALFDHEEVGSDSAQGAGSPAMLDALTRITGSFNHSNSKVQRNFLHLVVHTQSASAGYWI